jgi:hypothetical protein
MTINAKYIFMKDISFSSSIRSVTKTLIHNVFPPPTNIYYMASIETKVLIRRKFFIAEIRIHVLVHV